MTHLQRFKRRLTRVCAPVLGAAFVAFGQTAQAAPPVVSEMIDCSNTMTHVLPAGTIDRLTLRNDVVVFGWVRNGGRAIYQLDITSGARTPITSLTTAWWDEGPELVNDDFMVYARFDLQTLTSAMMGRWRGPDAAWGTGDDFEWPFDFATGFGLARANEGELVYGRATGPLGGPTSYEVARCDFFLGSSTPCWPGFVATEPIGWLPNSGAHPVGAGAYVRATSWSSSVWVDPGLAVNAWSSDAPLDTWGPFVGSRNLDGDLIVRAAGNPAGPAIWTVTADIGHDLRFSPTMGSNGHFRVGYVNGWDGYVADLGAGPPPVGRLTQPAATISPDGDDVAYKTGYRTIVIDACVF